MVRSTYNVAFNSLRGQKRPKKSLGTRQVAWHHGWLLLGRSRAVNRKPRLQLLHGCVTLLARHLKACMNDCCSMILVQTTTCSGRAHFQVKSQKAYSPLLWGAPTVHHWWEYYQEVMVVKTSAFQLHLSTRLPHWLLHTHVSLRYDKHSTVIRVIRYLRALFLGTNYCYSTGSGNEGRSLSDSHSPSYLCYHGSPWCAVLELLATSSYSNTSSFCSYSNTACQCNMMPQQSSVVMNKVLQCQTWHGTNGSLLR